MKLQTLTCPYCEKDKKSQTKGEHNSFRGWAKIVSQEEAVWHKDGTTLEIPLLCEIDYKHRWSLVIGQHENKVYMFKRMDFLYD